MQYEKCIEEWKSRDRIKELNNFFWKFTYGSNRIENNNTHLRDVKDIFCSRPLDSKSDITYTTEQEIRNHKSLAKEIINSFADNTMKEISIEFIKELHSKLMKDCYDDSRLSKGERPGKFKIHDYVVGLHDIGASPENVEEELKSLLEEVNEVKITPKNALKIVAYFHCWFESIHPFADGNGRVGRLLINYILLKNDLPPIVLYDRDRNLYYLTLEEFNETQDIMGMVKFLTIEAEKTWLIDYNKKYKKLDSFLQ